MKTVYKDAKKTIRINSELLVEMEKQAKALSMSFADYVVKLYQDSKERKSLEQIEKRLTLVEQKIDVA